MSVCEVIGGPFDYGVFYNYSLSTAIAWIFLGYLNLFYNKTANRQ